MCHSALVARLSPSLTIAQLHMPNASQLEFLRKNSKIACDTLDFHVAKNLGPFVDCTSNQIIAYFELLKHNADIISQAAHFAQEQHSEEDKRISCGVKAMMVLLSLRVLPYLSGRVHTQSSLHVANERDATVQDAREIINIYTRLSPGISTDRICIKIPSTYEGLSACRVLEDEGINTLGTTLFSREQAILAHEVGCTYVAPYVHLITGAIDQNKGFSLCEEIFQYYEAYGSKTQVMPDSLVSTEEVMRLAGVHNITISPTLLSDLAITTLTPDFQISPSYDRELALQARPQKQLFLGDESSFKKALASNTEASRKLEGAISIFLEFEVKMEEMMRIALRNLSS
ncbi:aldolase [Ramaria rubella]|nr:aldolase [Ramaria rubella]